MPLQIDHLKLTRFFKPARMLIVPDRPDVGKQAALNAIMTNNQYGPRQVMVVGNRLDSEIAAAQDLGMVTVWMRHGEGSRFQPPVARAPDYTIATLLELRTILASKLDPS